MDFEIINMNTLSLHRQRWIRFCGFLGLLNVAANRWLEGLPIRVFNLKK